MLEYSPIFLIEEEIISLMLESSYMGNHEREMRCLFLLNRLINVFQKHRHFSNELLRGYLLCILSVFRNDTEFDTTNNDVGLARV